MGRFSITYSETVENITRKTIDLCRPKLMRNGE